MPLKASHLALIGAGAIIGYSGIKGKGLGSAFRATIAGKSPATATGANRISGTLPGSYANTLATYSGTTASEQLGTTKGTRRNMLIGRILAAPYGWSAGRQWNDLVWLWDRESGWNQYAYNASGATGIPQALPYQKMPRAAWLPSQGGRASAWAQIAWGLWYIKTVYGNPAGAWASEQHRGWY